MSKNENVTLGVCFTKRDRRRSWRVSFRAHLTCRLARVQLTVASPVRKALTHLPSFSNASLQSFRLAERWLGGVGRVVRKAKKEEDPAATIEAGLDIYLFFPYTFNWAVHRCQRNVQRVYTHNRNRRKVCSVSMATCDSTCRRTQIECVRVRVRVCRHWRNQGR